MLDTKAINKCIIFLKEVPSIKEFIGCLIMFAAIIVAQLPDKQKKKTIGA